jgi:hypothetical protein
MIISVVIVIVSISDFGSNPWALYQPSSLYNALKGVLRRKPSALLTLVPSKTLYKCCRAQMCQNLSDSLSLPFIWGLFGFSPRYQAFFSTPSHISYEELLGCPSRHLEACQIIRYEAGIDTTIMDVLNKSCIGTHAYIYNHIPSGYVKIAIENDHL